jgi:hypothetical protein
MVVRSKLIACMYYVRAREAFLVVGPFNCPAVKHTESLPIIAILTE